MSEKRGHRATGSLRPRPVSSSNSHGYREIFISSRWAPAATGAEHAATIRKPSHQRDKDRPITRLDLALQRRPRGVGSGGVSSVQPTGAAGIFLPTRCWLRRKTIEPANRGKEDRYSPPGVCSGSSRTLVSLCH